MQQKTETRITKHMAIDESVDQTRGPGQGLRRWLSPPDPSINHNIARTAHHKGTAAWFFKGDIFNKWKSAPSSSLLWIHGRPGSGKSVFCSSIVEHVKALRKGGLASMAYFYFHFRDENKPSCKNLLRSILSQLATQSHHFSDKLTHLHSECKDRERQPSDHELTRCLKKMLLDPDQNPVYLIIDAVDECSDISESGMPSPREQVLKLIEELVGLCLPNLHLCVTSRIEVGERAVFKGSTTLSVSLHEQIGHREDIVNYVKYSVHSDPKMESWSENDKKLVVETLNKKSHGVFQLTCCQLESLRRDFSQDLGVVLRELPETLDQAYEQILKSVHTTNRDHVHRILQCLTIAIRPLCVEELAQMLAVDFGAVGRGRVPRVNSDWQTANQQQAMMSACSSLISVDSQTVQFSHFSVKEYLTSKHLANSRHVSRYHISLQSAHATLAQACLSVLLCLDDQSSRPNVVDFPLAQYAAKYWDVHVLFKGVASRVQDTIKSFLDGEKPHWKAWHRLCDDKKYADYCPVPLFYAAFYGLYEIVEHLITKHPRHVNPRVHSAGTPLNGALMGNHLDVAQLLLKRGAEVNMQDGTKSTLLHVASQASDKAVPTIAKILQWLLDHGADVHARDEKDKTPLHLAAEKGPLDTIRTLIKHRSDMEAQDKDGRTPLHLAVDGLSSEAVQVLLEHKAYVNSRDKKGKTPLHLAVHWRHSDIVRMLMKHNANVHEQDKEGRTPRDVAAARNWEHPDITRVLIKCKADVKPEVRSTNDHTPLHHVALDHRRLNMDPTLVVHKANIGVQNNKGQAVLRVTAVDRAKSHMKSDEGDSVSIISESSLLDAMLRFIRP